MKKPVIGFIGTGVMGSSMAKNLLAAGYPMNIYTRTPEKAKPLLEAGASWKNNPAELAAFSRVVITIVGFPADVEEVYFGKRGIFEGIKPGSAAADMTTSSPILAKRIYNRAVPLGVEAMDAPVSGGDRGARDGNLSIMAGGDRKSFNRLRPVFGVMGSTIVYQGPAGCGQHAKMSNQIAIASCMVGVCEAIAYAEKAGLKPETVLESIEKGAAGSWSLSNLAPRMIKGEFGPGFYVKHFIKDLKIALDSAAQLNLNLPGLKLAAELYETLAEKGGSDLGTQALIKIYKNREGSR